MFTYDFSVPYKKQYRVIICTDCKNEADDQYAIVHALMTPKLDVRGIIATHFEKNMWLREPGKSMEASYAEILKVVELMGLSENYQDRIFRGAVYPMTENDIPQVSEGARAIIEEALREDERRLFILAQGSLTDVAAALLMEPAIGEHITVIWTGGAIWPQGGQEFNLYQDPMAANVVFASEAEVWQIPMDAYNQMRVSLAELQLRVKSFGDIGCYLYSQMIELNDAMLQMPIDIGWPHGETWVLGDQCVLTVLLEELQSVNYRLEKAPQFAEDLSYVQGTRDKKIRVYHTMNTRLTMEDFYAKLELNYGKNK